MNSQAKTTSGTPAAVLNCPVLPAPVLTAFQLLPKVNFHTILLVFCWFLITTNLEHYTYRIVCTELIYYIDGNGYVYTQKHNTIFVLKICLGQEFSVLKLNFGSTLTLT